MASFNSLEVLLDGQKVGTLALYQKYRAAFEYDPDWLRSGFSLNPYALPLKPGVFIPDYEPFGGLFGVFADSLPDGWGRLLVDRMLLREHRVPESLNVLERLAPAYDLTPGVSLFGEHATSVNGNGKNPGPAEILAVAEKIGLPKSKAENILTAIRAQVGEELGESRGQVL